MKEITCDCGADFKTQNENELVEIAKIHAKRTHNESVTEADVRKKIKDAYAIDEEADTEEA